jgi:hypothetical protein
MGRADYYKHGDANAICDRCGQKFKHSELQREWTGLLVCGPGGNDCFEQRHPQDHLRAMRDRQTQPNARPEQGDKMLTDNEITIEDLK